MSSGSTNAWEWLSKAVFEIGGEDQLAALRKQFPTTPADDEGRERLDAGWRDFVKHAGIRIGTLLKSDNISFLIAAGASKEAGGILLGNVPNEIEKQLLTKGINGKQQVASWLKLFYEAIRRIAPEQIDTPVTDDWVRRRQAGFSSAQPLKVNYEQVLACLFRWGAVLTRDGDSFQLGPAPEVKIDSSALKDAVEEAKKSLISCCDLPIKKDPDALKVHKEFLKKVLTRPLNLKRVNLFTLNYDTLLEKAADAEGIVLMDGFIGTIRRTFRPESFDQDLYFPAETTEGRVHRLERVLHLYKLHGSVNWISQESTWNDPYGIVASEALQQSAESILVYPTPSKYGDILGMPYTELFRRFAASIVRRQSTLFIIGYGFGDDHVNAIIRQAMAIPSFSLVIVDPFAPAAGSGSGFVASLRAQKDRRVWVISGEALGAFSQFVEVLLPDLRDEEILIKVMKTYRAVGGADETNPSVANDHVE